MKKKILASVMCVALAGTLLAGCGSSSDESAAATTETEEEEVDVAVEETEAADEEEAAEAIENSSEKTAADYNIAVVPKMTNLAWFERMEWGVNEYNEENGTDVFYGGSTDGDGQAAYVEGLLSQGYDAICVVPYDVEALDPILEKARDAGIVVICHEASTMENMDYDVEAFNTYEYGAHLMEKIAELTGGEGEYIQTIAGLTSQSHVEEADGGKEYADAYTDMTMYGDRILSDDNEDTAYNKVKEALTANPDIVAIQCAAMSETPGAARAVEELGLAGKVYICGTSLNSVCEKYVEDGTVQLMSFWDPALAGDAMIELAVATLNGTAGDDTLSLPVEGYEDLVLEGNVYTGNAWIDVDQSNYDDPAYDF